MDVWKVARSDWDGVFTPNRIAQLVLTVVKHSGQPDIRLSNKPQRFWQVLA